MNGSFLNRLLAGVVVITVGVLFLLRQLGHLEFEVDLGYIISTYWPVILLFVGLQGIVAGRSAGAGSGWWGAMLMLIGFVFLGRNLEWFDWSIGDIISYIWPVAIILIGVNLIRKPRSKHHAPPQDEWKSYGAYTDTSGKVPPAPPLHPDPTKAGISLEKDMNKETTQQFVKEENAQEQGWEGIPPHKKWYYQSKHHHKHNEWTEWWNNDPKAQTRSGFIGDIHIGHDYWELKPLNISHFIGDTVIDLTKAQIPLGETRICISSFIGDVKIYVPNDYEVGIQVISSAFVGDAKILGHKESGIFKNMNVHSPSYMETDKKIKLVVSTFIGDVRVTKVG